MKKLFWAMLIGLFLVAGSVLGEDLQSYPAGFSGKGLVGKTIYAVEKGSSYLLKLDFKESYVDKSIFDIQNFEGQVAFDPIGRGSWVCGEGNLILTSNDEYPGIVSFKAIKFFFFEKRITVWTKTILGGIEGEGKFPYYMELELFYDQEEGYGQSWRFMATNLK